MVDATIKEKYEMQPAMSEGIEKLYKQHVECITVSLVVGLHPTTTHIKSQQQQYLQGTSGMVTLVQVRIWLM